MKQSNSLGEVEFAVGISVLHLPDTGKWNFVGKDFEELQVTEGLRNEILVDLRHDDVRASLSWLQLSWGAHPKDGCSNVYNITGTNDVWGVEM